MPQKGKVAMKECKENCEKLADIEDKIDNLYILLNKRVTFLTILSLLVSPKMVLALCLGIAFIVQMMRGG